MADKDTLWTAVTTRYDADGLITLTRIKDPDTNTVNTVVGTEAANGVINLWPAYAQVDFDISDGLHIEAAVLGVIAMLFRRGGAAVTIEQVKWETVFAKDGVIAMIKNTGPRGRRGPKSNSGVRQRAETVNGRKVKGWSDRDALDSRINMPTRRLAD